MPDPIHDRHDSCPRPDGLSGPARQPRDLPIQVRLLIMRGHPRIQTEGSGGLSGRSVRRHQHRPLVHPHRRNRQPPLPKPPVRRLRMHTLSTRPLRQIHTNNTPARTFIRSLSLTIS
jgi:hypothetical protein